MRKRVVGARELRGRKVIRLDQAGGLEAEWVVARQCELVELALLERVALGDDSR